MEALQPFGQIRVLYGDLLQLSKKQLLLAQNINIDQDLDQEIMNLFQKRQEIMEQIELLLLEKIEQKHQPQTGLSSEKTQANTNDEISREIIAIIRDIHAHDEVGRKIIEKSQQSIGKKLAGLKKNRVAANAYLNFESGGDAWFFDQKR